MKNRIMSSDREILSIMSELSKAVRCCRQDEMFCEDVTYTQFIILDAVEKNQTLNMAKLHDVLSVEKSTTTRLVAPLIKRGLIVRERSDHDSRAATLKLTDQGRDVHKKVWQCLLSFIRAVRDEIPQNKRPDVLEGVRMFLNAMQKVSELRCEVEGGSYTCKCIQTIDEAHESTGKLEK